ncbi:hypothetical protein [Bradyrhizobium sp. SZCCHNS1012]|uniref:hypothetical protein n=1 Tax=Bradyrhizobium sp. SZCCHNS1012 TaxID=3057297 RepID=UPI00291707AF|nr:hypothetical protein [Bradyrhizobium sp. SZCCHNS1012]
MARKPKPPAMPRASAMPTNQPMPGGAAPYQAGPGLGAPNVSLKQPKAAPLPPAKAINTKAQKAAAAKPPKVGVRQQRPRRPSSRGAK